MIAFGPLDGRLYIGTGDGGGGCDPGTGLGNAQKILSNLGKILRLDVDSLPYGTSGNPFAGSPGNDEIWARGLRNPWRWSFDRVTGAMYIGDVGEDTWEEVDCVLAGRTTAGRTARAATATPTRPAATSVPLRWATTRRSASTARPERRAP
jgi:hypothetical protein